MATQLTEDQVNFYRDNGYLVLPGHLPSDIIDKARSEIDVLSAHAATIDQSDDKIDLEETHTRTDPRIRRIKRPDLQSDFFRSLLNNDLILGPARSLLGDDIRLQTAKLNMKKAQYGAPVQWHQDWAFYPYTNDDVLAIGIVFDDMDEENGPLQVIPGTHRGPVLNHHNNGYFHGSVDLAEAGLSLDDAVSLKGPAGTVSIHHARVLHGSALNRSARDRKMLFYEMMAADAYPIFGAMVEMEGLESLNWRIEVIGIDGRLN